MTRRSTTETSAYLPKRQRGLAMVEMTLITPVVLLLLVSTAELGRGFQQYNALTKSLRDSTRYAAEVATTSGGSTGVVNINAADRTAIQNLVAYGNTAGTGPAILPGLNAGSVVVTGSTNGVVDVSVSYNYQPIFLSIPTFGFSADINPNFTFQANVTMRAL